MILISGQSSFGSRTNLGAWVILTWVYAEIVSLVSLVIPGSLESVQELLSPRKFAIRTWFCNCPQYLCLFHIVVECSPSIRDPRKDVGSPKSTSLLSTFHVGSRFCCIPANFMSSTYTDKNNPFSRCTKRHSQFGTFSQPCFNGIFSNCLSHNSLAKGWPFKRNDWIFHTGPWFRPFVSW